MVFIFGKDLRENFFSLCLPPWFKLDQKQGRFIKEWSEGCYPSQKNAEELFLSITQESFMLFSSEAGCQKGHLLETGE